MTFQKKGTTTTETNTILLDKVKDITDKSSVDSNGIEISTKSKLEESEITHFRCCYSEFDKYD